MILDIEDRLPETHNNEATKQQTPKHQEFNNEIINGTIIQQGENSLDNRQVQTEVPSPRRFHLPHVLYISLVLLAYQSLANSSLGILLQITSQHGSPIFGSLTISLLFLGSSLGALWNSYIGRYSYKILFFVGSFGYIIFLGILTLFLIIDKISLWVVSSALIGGLLCSIFYNSQFNYINQCSYLDHQPTKYYGLNIGLVQTANIIGNLISFLLIKPLGQLRYSEVMTASICFISLFFLGTKKVMHLPRQQGFRNQDLESSNTTNKQNLLQHQNRGQNGSSVQNSQTNRQFPYLLLLTFTISGIMLAFIYSQLSLVLYRAFPNLPDEDLNHLTFILFVFQGMGQFFGGMGLFYFQSSFKSKLKSLFFCSIGFLTGWCIIMIGAHLQNPTIMILGSCFCGVFDSAGYSLSLSVAGNWGKKGISLFQFCQCLSISIFGMGVGLMGNQIAFIMGIIFLGNWVLIPLLRRDLLKI